jgi:N utilization substance protein B
MKPRRHARMVALQVLYETDAVAHPLAQVLEQRLAEEPLPPEGQAFARRLVCGVMRHLALLDTWIARFAPEWPVNQLAIIDRNVLRLALFELAGGGDAPVKVVINEAVELAKTFGSDSSPRFVNGVLGSFVAAGDWPRLPDSGEGEGASDPQKVLARAERQ